MRKTDYVLLSIIFVYMGMNQAYGQSGTLSLDSLEKYKLDKYKLMIHPVDTSNYTLWSIGECMVTISDSLGVVAERKCDATEWTVIDCQRTINILHELLNRQTEKIIRIQNVLYKDEN